MSTLVLKQLLFLKMLLFYRDDVFGDKCVDWRKCRGGFLEMCKVDTHQD